MTTATSRYNGLVGSVAIKQPVKVATTANITLSGIQTIDSVTLVSGDRVLVKNQSNAINNGIYTVSSGTWQRSADFNGAYDAVQGTMISVVSGSANAGYIFTLDSVAPVIGTSTLSFSQKTFQAAGLKTFAYYGVVGDGSTDDTTALSNALNSGQEIYCRDEVIKFSKVTANSAVRLIGKVTLQHDGSTITGTSALTFNSTVRADHLIVRGNSTDSVYDIMATTASGVYIDTLELQSTAEQGGRGGYTNNASDVFIDKIISKNIARPFVSESSGSALSNIHIGSITVDNYIRAIKFDNCFEFSVGSVFLKNRWSGVGATPGYNGILLSNVHDFKIGDCYVADAPEHAIRIGGGADVYNFSIGNITAVNSGGCAVKFNVDPTYICKDWSIGAVNGVNCGEGNSTGNKEVVRLTRIKNGATGSIGGSVSITTCLIFADVDNLTVEGLNVTNVNGRCLKMDETQDTSNGIIKDVYVGYITGDANSIRALIEVDYNGSGRTVENVVIDNVNATGYTDYLVTMANGCTLNGVLKVSATVPSTLVAPFTESPVDDARYITDITYNGQRYIGRGDSAVFSGNMNIEAENSLSLAATPATKRFGTFFAQCIKGTAALGAYGASYIMSRVGSGRRGGGIALKQTGSSAFQNGISFLTQSSGTTDETLTESMVLKHTGVLFLASLPVYANNAAAVAGGLVVGDCYKTAAGELRIVV